MYSHIKLYISHYVKREVIYEQGMSFGCNFGDNLTGMIVHVCFMHRLNCILAPLFGPIYISR